MATGHNARTPLSNWFIFQVSLPLLQIAIGGLAIALASRSTDPAALVEGLTLSIFSVTLLSGVVGTHVSPTPGSIPQEWVHYAYAALGAVVIVSAAVAALYYADAVHNRDMFVKVQIMMTGLAIPISWLARI